MIFCEESVHIKVKNKTEINKNQLRRQRVLLINNLKVAFVALFLYIMSDPPRVFFF